MKNNKTNSSNDILKFFPRPFKLHEGILFNEKDDIIGHFGKEVLVKGTDEEIKIQEQILLRLNSFYKDAEEIPVYNDLKYTQLSNLWIEIYNGKDLIFTIADSGVVKTGNLTESERTKNQIHFLKWMLEMLSPVTEDKILVTDEDKQTFANALINPPFPNKKLKEAKENHDKVIKGK